MNLNLKKFYKLRTIKITDKDQDYISIRNYNKTHYFDESDNIFSVEIDKSVLNITVKVKGISSTYSVKLDHLLESDSDMLERLSLVFTSNFSYTKAESTHYQKMDILLKKMFDVLNDDNFDSEYQSDEFSINVENYK